MKSLLTSVFGPYGMDDEYGEKENKMKRFYIVIKVKKCFSKKYVYPEHKRWLSAT